MPAIANPLKSFNFAIEIAGLNQFAAQEVKLPAPELESVEHGGSNSMVKTAGMSKTGDMEIKQLRALDGSDSWAWAWIRQAQNPVTGTGNIPSVYKKTCVVRELAPDGITTVHAYLCTGVWVKKIDPEAFKRTGSENMMQNVTLSVDNITLLF